jgi:hypothetical protein
MRRLLSGITFPEPMKIPSFRYTAVGLLLFTAVTYPISISDDSTDDRKTYSAFYHWSVFIGWALASFVNLLACEWKLQRVYFIRYIRERFLGLQPPHCSKIALTEVDQPVSFDAMMLVPYAYSMFATFDSLIRTAMNDQSRQRDIATTNASTSYTICGYALIGSGIFAGRDKRTGIYVYSTDLRHFAWVVLESINLLTLAFGFTMGRTYF